MYLFTQLARKLLNLKNRLITTRCARMGRWFRAMNVQARFYSWLNTEDTYFKLEINRFKRSGLFTQHLSPIKLSCQFDWFLEPKWIQKLMTICMIWVCVCFSKKVLYIDDTLDCVLAIIAIVSKGGVFTRIYILRRLTTKMSQ